MTDRELIERLLFLAETAEDYFIYCELRELAAALEAQPDPQGPSELELEAIELKLWDKHRTKGCRGEGFMYDNDFSAALDEYRDLLARPEPQGPTDAELDALFTEVDQGGECQSWRAFARAVLARWGTPAIQPVPVSERLPEPQGPTEMEIIAFWSEHCAGDGDAGILRLARWGRPAIEPVPVSWRLPGPEDCDAEGLCWWWSRDITAWCLCFAADGDSSEWTHWLPHWALPVPAPANTINQNNY
jgi:hypothetical protein